MGLDVSSRGHVTSWAGRVDVGLELLGGSVDPTNMAQARGNVDVQLFALCVYFVFLLRVVIVNSTSYM